MCTPFDIFLFILSFFSSLFLMYKKVFFFLLFRFAYNCYYIQCNRFHSHSFFLFTATLCDYFTKVSVANVYFSTCICMYRFILWLVQCFSHIYIILTYTYMYTIYNICTIYIFYSWVRVFMTRIHTQHSEKLFVYFLVVFRMNSHKKKREKKMK